MLGQEQPQAQEIARDFIRQELSNLPLQPSGVGAFDADALSGALGGQPGRWIFGVEAVEFFLNPVIGNDALDAPETDLVLGLTDFLGNPSTVNLNARSCILPLVRPLGTAVQSPTKRENLFNHSESVGFPPSPIFRFGIPSRTISCSRCST